ncbi:MAG: RNase H family protein [Anaerolineae bacterium]|nr:RNase H family protein [Anaerolineae bacterium]
MPSPYKKQLTSKADGFIQAINTSLGYHAEIDYKSFDEYSVEIRFHHAGRAKLYYSPKRDYYTLTSPKLDKSHAPKIMDFWYTMLANEAKPSVIKISKSAYQAFVDGSFDSQRQSVGYGAVILKQGDEIERLSGFVNKYLESRQIAGELASTMRVIAWCKQNNVNEIDIFYDYKGIKEWAIGNWKLEKPMAQSYSKYVNESGIKVYWHKVASHTGVHWNEIADKLAKKGAEESETKVPQVESLESTSLGAIGEAFAAHLKEKGFQARYDSVKNHQFARIGIYQGKKRLGFFDLYDTKKRRLDPYRTFASKRYQEQECVGHATPP